MQMQEQRWHGNTLWGAGDWSALRVFFVKNKSKQIKAKRTSDAIKDSLDALFSKD